MLGNGPLAPLQNHGVTEALLDDRLDCKILQLDTATSMLWTSRIKCVDLKTQKFSYSIVDYGVNAKTQQNQFLWNSH